MLKFLGNDTWAVVKGDDILVQAKIWYYDQLLLRTAYIKSV